jgi:hypothetical protein
MRRAPLLVPELAIAIVPVALWWLAAPRALAQPGAAPASCRAGAYLTALHAFDPECPVPFSQSLGAPWALPGDWGPGTRRFLKGYWDPTEGD